MLWAISNKIDTDLIPSNIKNWVEIFWVVWTYSPATINIWLLWALPSNAYALIGSGPHPYELKAVTNSSGRIQWIKNFVHLNGNILHAFHLVWQWTNSSWWWGPREVILFVTVINLDTDAILSQQTYWMWRMQTWVSWFPDDIYLEILWSTIFIHTWLTSAMGSSGIMDIYRYDINTYTITWWSLNSWSIWWYTNDNNYFQRWLIWMPWYAWWITLNWNEQITKSAFQALWTMSGLWNSVAYSGSTYTTQSVWHTNTTSSSSEDTFTVLRIPYITKT